MGMKSNEKGEFIAFERDISDSVSPIRYKYSLCTIKPITDTQAQLILNILNYDRNDI